MGGRGRGLGRRGPRESRRKTGDGVWNAEGDPREHERSEEGNRAKRKTGDGERDAEGDPRAWEVGRGEWGEEGNGGARGFTRRGGGWPRRLGRRLSAEGDPGGVGGRERGLRRRGPREMGRRTGDGVLDAEGEPRGVGG